MHSAQCAAHKSQTSTSFLNHPGLQLFKHWPVCRVLGIGPWQTTPTSLSWKHRLSAPIGQSKRLCSRPVQFSSLDHTDPVPLPNFAVFFTAFKALPRPSCRHATVASRKSKVLPQTVLHDPFTNTSNRPCSSVEFEPFKRMRRFWPTSLGAQLTRHWLPFRKRLSGQLVQLVEDVPSPHVRHPRSHGLHCRLEVSP